MANVGAVFRRGDLVERPAPRTARALHAHPLQRYTGRRETYGEIDRAVASLLSDRAARRTTHRR